MRFQNGSKVEVLSKTEVPPGSWHCAEVICGNAGDGDYTIRYTCAGSGNIIERVSRNAVRPCPPLSEFSENLAPGDVVEVFDGNSWKIATILESLWKNQFLVRLLGFSLEFKVSRTDIRVRQSWEDNKWVVIGKGSANCQNEKHYESLCNLSSRVQTTNMNIADTMTCSVGSCSITGSNAYEMPHEDFDSLSDAESCCPLGHEEGNRPLQAMEIHELELHAYRCTMGALHACGPLSWEQEALVTNLRLLLNISNDEHLVEIKSLISAGNRR